jgi:hypothetical protein
MSPAGSWKSTDGSVRLTLRGDGTYAGLVAGRRQRAYGTYHVDGRLVTLSDHGSGLHTPVRVLDGELEMAGHRFTRCR